MNTQGNKNKIIFISPTGREVIRVDEYGDGHFKARRRTSNGSSYFHKGIDYSAKLGQCVIAPTSATFRRIAYPYDDSKEYLGGYFETPYFDYVLFYFTPCIEVGISIKQGELIGYAQNISARYNLDRNNKKMDNHIHAEITMIDPMYLNKLLLEK